MSFETSADRHPRSGYLRHPACVPVRLRQVPRPVAADPRRDGRPCGAIQFTVSQTVPAGATVEVAVDVAGETRRFRGNVHWVRPAGRRFVVGLRLTDPEDACRARMIEQACHVEAYRQRAIRRSGRSLGIEQAAARWIERCAERFAHTWETQATG